MLPKSMRGRGTTEAACEGWDALPREVVVELWMNVVSWDRNSSSVKGFIRCVNAKKSLRIYIFEYLHIFWLENYRYQVREFHKKRKNVIWILIGKSLGRWWAAGPFWANSVQLNRKGRLYQILTSSARTSRGRKFPKGKELYSTERICL